ncbi:MAG: MHS family MFS transporter [Planctomycetes bacterium]|nr:MHS family MFS transporter [Planctomycetota bacterium]
MNSPAYDPKAVRRVILASFIGTTIEWYDFFLYGTASALVLDKLYFPTFDPTAAKMAAFATYAVGFFARPLGGVVFGHFGDRIGRKSMLVTTLLLMGIATFFVGLVPTYESIGVAAPILLVVLRFIQGFGVGGEWGGAVLMAVEHSQGGKRGLSASWPQAGVPAGLLLSTGVFYAFASLPEDQFLSWGWRVPFLLGILLVGVGLFIRLSVMETPLFAKALETKVSKIPILDAIREHPKNIVLAMGARFAENVYFYIMSAFVISYATAQLKLPKSVVLNGVLAASAVEFCTVPFFGWLSDRLGRRPVYLFGAIFSALFAFPFFWLLDTKSSAAIMVALVCGLSIGHAAMYGPQAAFFSELFGTKVRYSGASLGYQLSSPFAGGLAPLIATALLKYSDGDPWPVAAYLVACAAITILSVYLAAETSQQELM